MDTCHPLNQERIIRTVCYSAAALWASESLIPLIWSWEPATKPEFWLMLAGAVLMAGIPYAAKWVLAWEKHRFAELQELLRELHEHMARMQASREVPPAWHEILRTRPDAPLGEVRAAYRKIAKLVHPDTAKPGQADPEFFRLATEAYDAAQADIRSRHS